MKKLELQSVQNTLEENKKYAGVFLGILLILLTVLASSYQDRDIEVRESISPTGHDLNSTSDYRFANVDGEIMYGPYIHENSRYYYFNGEVLDSDYNIVDNRNIEHLHKFYIQTYTDPLYYAPGSQEEMDLSGFKQFEEDKILSKECGLEYDVIPQSFLNNLTENHQSTDKFLQTASTKNAENLIDQNRKTVHSYSSYIGDFIDNINREVWMNECFDNETRNNGFARSTFTEPQYMIDTEIMANYSRMGNENAKKSLREINEREKLLKQGGTIKYPENNVTIKQFNYNYSNMMTPEEARSEMRIRMENEEKQAIEHLADIEDEDDREENHSHPHGEDEEEINYSNVDVDLEFPEIDETPEAYDINSICKGYEYAPVYGWDKQVYPNVMIGTTNYIDSAQSQLWDFFTVCRCPYTEISRLKWYTIDDLYNQINLEETQNMSNESKEATEIFLNNPGDQTMNQMAEKYESEVVKSVKTGEYNPNIDTMWKVSQKSNSKINYLGKTYTDFYSKQHMDVWSSFFDVESNSNQHQRYNYFLIQESLYALNFMTWSDSAWRLEDKPKKLGEEIEYKRLN